MTRTLPARLVGALALTLSLAACGTQAGGPATESASPASPTIPPATPAPTSEDDAMTSSDSPFSSTSPDQPTGAVGADVAELPEVKEAIAAEAERAGVDPAAVTVVGYAEVTWSDGSLGCPQPGMMYTQALVPGYQLVLEADGQRASYHAGKDKVFRYCATPKRPASTTVDQ